MPFYLESEHDMVLICSRYHLDCEVSFFYLLYSQTHGLSFQNELHKDPIKPYWEDHARRGAVAYKKYYSYWINKAETSDIPIYFFRFEDVIANPQKEVTEVMRFVLGMESMEGTVMEQRVKEVLGWEASLN